MLDHHALLAAILAADPDLSYGFVADEQGTVVARAGTTASLPHSHVVAVSERPESIRSFYGECLEHLRTDPTLVPQLYSQGRTEGVIGIPCKQHLIALFGTRPEHIHSAPSDARVRWVFAFRTRVWAAVSRSYPAVF